MYFSILSNNDQNFLKYYIIYLLNAALMKSRNHNFMLSLSYRSNKSHLTIIEA